MGERSFIRVVDRRLQHCAALLVVISALALPKLVQASAPSAGPGPLKLADVLRSVERSHPKLAAAQADVDGKRGDRLAAAGAFDPKLQSQAQSLVNGYYEYWQWNNAITQQLPAFGLKLEGGYRFGRGDIPTYYGERATRSGGELYAKLQLPLLAGRSIDDARAGVRLAYLGIKESRQRARLAWLGLSRDATVAYWQWVAAGRKLEMAQELLVIAKARADQIASQALRGARPEIENIDAQRVLLARENRERKARGEFAKAKAKLSLYYRDDSGQPQFVDTARVPQPRADAPTLPSFVTSFDSLLKDAMAARPELGVLDAQADGAAVELSLAKNARLPQLDLQTFVARDLGTGADSLGRTDIGIGVVFSLPLLQRKARGKAAKARAKSVSVRAKRRFARDIIAADLKRGVEIARLSIERLRLGQARLQATRALADGERKRLAQGSGDVLRVNLRELDVAASAVDVIDARLQLDIAIAELYFARGMTQAVGK